MITQKTAFVLFFSCWVLVSLGQETDSTSSLIYEPFEESKQILFEAKKHLLLMLKLGNEIQAQDNGKGAREEGRAIGNLVPIYETRYDTTSFIRYAEPNERFEILSRDPGYVEIMTKEDQRGYVYAANIASTGSLNKFRKKASNNLKPNLELLARLYEGLTDLELRFADSGRSLDKSNKKYIKIANQFENTIQNAKTYYEDNFEEIDLEEVGSKEFLNRISGQVRISRGQSRFGDDFNGEVTTEQKSSSGEIGLDLSYDIDPSSNAEFSFSTDKEVLETAYRNTNLSVGYNKRFQKTSLRTSLGYDKYKDYFSGVNDYGRLQLNAHVDHRVKKGTSLQAAYGLINNNYSSGDVHGFTQHRLTAFGQFSLNNHRELRLGFNSNLSTSKQNEYNTIFLNPEIRLSSRKANGRKTWIFRHELYNYPDLPLRNLNRFGIGLNNNVRKDNGKSISTQLSGDYILYAENNVADHARFAFRVSKSKFKNWHTSSSLGFTAKYFANNQASSFSDIRWDLSASKKIHTEFSLFSRLWYPEESFGMLAEADFKLGFKAWDLIFGPTLSARADLDSDEVKFKADGNNYRFGAFLRGRKSFAIGLRIVFDAAYNYGSVYGEEFAVDSNGGIIPGQVALRHPTTFRLSSGINYNLMNLFDLFVNIDYFNIDRDFAADEGFNSALESNRMSYRIGVVYHYN